MLRRLAFGTALGAAFLSSLVAGTPATITPVTQQTQTITPGLSVALVVQVSDAGSVGVPSQLVVFSVTGGSLSSYSAYTNSSGQAFTYFTAPATAGTYIVTATVSGYALTTNFYFTVGTGTGTTAGSITAVNAYVTVAAGATATLSARVVDIYGQAVPYQYVTFTAPSGGYFSNPTVYTDASGYATAYFTAPASTGTYLVYATAGSLTASFTITVGTGTTTTGTGMQIYSGNGQVVSVYTPTTPRPLTVVVRDSNGNPVPNAYVNWAVTSGAASLSTSLVYTDSYGLAKVLATGTSPSTYMTYQTATITASSSYGTVNFTLVSLGVVTSGSTYTPITAYAGILAPSSGTTITGKAGQVLSGAIRAQVYTSTNAPLPYAGLDVTVADLEGPTAACAVSALSDASGIVQCDLVLGKKVGEGSLTVNVGSLATATYSFSVTPGDPASATVIQGDGQSGRPGETLSQALVAEFRDAGGAAIQGMTALWEFGTGGTGARLTNVRSVTDASGQVSANVTLGSRAGTLVVRVKASSNTSIAATFNLKVSVPVAGLVKISGDNQAAITGQAFAAPLVVEVRDTQMLPVANVTVTFTVGSGSATLSGATATTGSDGRASVTVTAGATAGSITVSASADSQTVVFNLTSRLPGPVLTAASFVNGASYKQGLVPGSVTAIVGAGLAPGIQGCVGPGTVVGPLPTKVANVEVVFGGNLAPIFAVCNVSGQEQVIVQAPWEMAPGFTVMVKVSVGAGATVVDRVPVLAALPGIFETTAADSRRFAVAVGPDGGLISPAKRAKRGDIVRFYGTGLGTVIPLAATNQPGAPGQVAWFPVIAGIGGKGVRVVSAGLALNMIGVYEIAVEIPADAPMGDDVALDLAIQTSETSSPVFAATSKISIQ